MARVSKFINSPYNIFSEIEKMQLTTCAICDKQISKGGFWSVDWGISLRAIFSVCPSCSSYLIEILIDILDDSDMEFKSASPEEKEETILAIAQVALQKKERKKRELNLD